MDWKKCMNQAMTYIENNLANKVDYNLVAKQMNCSEWEFRRVFSFLVQIPLSEYVRNRRLTVAILNIQNGERIIDVAGLYGYESQAAFSRAFSKLHGLAPSLARDKDVKLNPYPRLTFKLVLMEGDEVENDSKKRINIGGGGVIYGIGVDKDQNTIHKTNKHFWNIKGNEVIGALALPLYGAFVSEEKHQLLGDLTGKKVLDIGCGSGDSLQYVGERGASELWGLDISNEQIKKTKQHLETCNLSAKLICSPMEVDCGIPNDYFDIVYSVYGIGWTTDLEGTFRRINSYLKPDGVFIFSWSHPIHKCVAVEDDMLDFKKCYFDESWYSVTLEGDAISLADRKVSTYINALAKAGFIIEEMIETSDEEILESRDDQFAQKAKMLPVTLVIKARKI